MSDDKSLLASNDKVIEGLGKKIMAKCVSRGFEVSKLTLSFLDNSVQYRFYLTSTTKTIFPVVITIRETESRLFLVKENIDYHPDKRGGESKAPLDWFSSFFRIGDEYGDTIELPVDGRERDDLETLRRLEATVIVCINEILGTTIRREQRAGTVENEQAKKIIALEQERTTAVQRKKAA
jgi:hypothetical protein